MNKLGKKLLRLVERESRQKPQFYFTLHDPSQFNVGLSDSRIAFFFQIRPDGRVDLSVGDKALLRDLDAVSTEVRRMVDARELSGISPFLYRDDGTDPSSHPVRPINFYTISIDAIPRLAALRRFENQEGRFIQGFVISEDFANKEIASDEFSVFFSPSRV